MKKQAPIGERGFIKMVLVIVIALLVVSYFGINIRALVDSPTTKENFSYVASTTVSVWNNYLKAPATFIWDKVIIDMIWKPATLKDKVIQ